MVQRPQAHDVPSIGSKSLNLRKKEGVKFNDLYFKTNWLERSLSHFSMILPLDFSEILNISRKYSLFHISAHFIIDVIKFLNHRPEE